MRSSVSCLCRNRSSLRQEHQHDATASGADFGIATSMASPSWVTFNACFGSASMYASVTVREHVIQVKLPVKAT